MSRSPWSFGEGERNRRKAAPAFRGVYKSTYVYVDAFNLYYGAVRGTSYKWLNIDALCKNILTDKEIVKIRYFTALVKARPSDPNQPNRQQLYLRALGTLPNVQIHYGSFQTSIVSKRRANGFGSVKVLDTEEKGSDVNLATYLIHDGHQGLYETAVIISNDSDLIEAVRIVKYELNKTVGIVNPQKTPSSLFESTASFYKTLRKGVLRSSQFPDQMNDSKGSFHKPASW